MLAASLALLSGGLSAQTINPTPHYLVFDPEGMALDISSGIRLDDVKGKFSEDLGFLEASGINLCAESEGGKRGWTKVAVNMYVDYGEKFSSSSGSGRASVKPVSGAYFLTIGSDGISITGYDECGAFYGIQTLRQLVENAEDPGKLPYLTIADWPDLPNRGVVEGFYGTPWSHETRLSLIDFYGKFKMNVYVYGPKDDPYHSSPNWRLPYPDDEAEDISELIDACRRNRIDFVWAIHPGQDIKWNEEDYANLLNKFEMMYGLGVRNFAIFFDDISGEGTNPVKQAGLLNRLTADFVEAKGDVSPLTVCPTDYSKLWANPGPDGNLSIYGNELNEKIKVFWTGDYVCSDLTRETLDWVNSRIKRPAYYWWNYPVTDYVRNIILQGPVYGLDTILTDKELCGVLSNPMEHGEASKLALYGVADYTWNISAYRPQENWERALKELVPDAAEAYRTFAIHSCDTETGYRRYESWETETFRLDQWTQAAADALWAEFDRVEKAPGELDDACANRALLDELRPWLTEFAKLGTRGKRAVELMGIYRSGMPDTALFWEKYSQNIMSAEDRKSYEAHKSGTMKLQPFYENAMSDMGFGFLASLSGKTPKEYSGIGSFSNSGGMTASLMFDGDSTTYYTSGVSQKDGSWVGVDLRTVRDIRGVSILQGRNSTDDVDYFNHAVVEYSVDGKDWKPLTGELEGQYVINWSGEGVEARYIRLKRLASDKKNYIAIRSFDIITGDENTGNENTQCGEKAAAPAFDGRISTSYSLDGEISWKVPEGISEYIILSRFPDDCGARLKLIQYASDGSVISETDVDKAYFKIQPGRRTATLSLSGNASIVEIVGR